MQIGRRQGVVDDERHAGALRHLRDRREVGDDAARIGDRFDEDRLGARRDGALEGGDVVGIGPHHVPAEALEGVVELVDRAAIERARGDEFVARRQQRLEGDELRGMAGADGERRGAAFQRGDALLQHAVGRVADAAVDIAERLQPEQRGGVVDIVEHEGGGLVDRRHPRLGGRVRLRAGMDGERGEAGAMGVGAVGHRRSPVAFGKPSAPVSRAGPDKTQYRCVREINRVICAWN